MKPRFCVCVYIYMYIQYFIITYNGKVRNKRFSLMLESKEIKPVNLKRKSTLNTLGKD